MVITSKFKSIFNHTINHPVIMAKTFLSNSVFSIYIHLQKQTFLDSPISLLYSLY